MKNVLLQSAIQATAATAGAFIDNAIFSQEQRVDGPRLESLQAVTSTEGSPVARVWGRMRVGGQLIWATDFRERQVESSAGGGKGGGGGVTTVEYLYSASFAIGLCEGEIDGIARMWADGSPMDLTGVTYRVYKGTETQTADSLITSIEGTDDVPPFRGLAYIVFEDLELATFGNRIPQINVEVIRSAKTGIQAENLIKAVDMIPASGEFVYSDQVILQDLGPGATAPETVHSVSGQPDILEALDQMGDTLPNVGQVALVVAWFGDDLRCGSIALKPGVESREKVTTPETWSVNGLDRTTAFLISKDADDNPIYGGTPSDASVVAAIQELKARGYGVTFYPFILMDVPAGNGLTDPYGGAEQAAFPWRGRITCTPAPGQPGTPDKTAAAGTQVSAMFGTAAASDFSVSGETVSWTGGSDWGIRRMILHYAHLCEAAGGVDAFIIGTEMRALTQVRDGATSYPAVTAFRTLAADVSAILDASTKVSYAADWSEYFGHHPDDGTGDILFHLDPLWSDANIDFVAIDNYMPLSDWRDGVGHTDYLAGNTSIYDRDYLKANVEGGEGYDWFYASTADRDAQTRTTIEDGAYSEPWVFRYKDLRNWWSNAHYDRPGSVKSGSPTGWTAESKPIWFTEVGCPAVDKGSNQPNVFVDPKSSESAYPYYSNGVRDDLIQRRYIEAMFDYWDPTGANNPTSSVYSAPMIDLDHCFVWTWDARPYPEFPVRTDVWSDGPNWELGHWINGRMGRGDLGEIVREIVEAAGFTDVDVSGLSGVVSGYVINNVESPRASLAPLMTAFQFDAIESGTQIKFQHRGGGSAVALTEDDLVADGGGSDDWEVVRGQETELPVIARFTFVDGEVDYGNLTVEARRQAGQSQRVTAQSFPISMPATQASGLVMSWLMEQWRARERMSLALAPSRMAIEPADIVDLTLEGRSQDWIVTTTRDAGARPLELSAYDAGLYALPHGISRDGELGSPVVYGPPAAVFLDGPNLTGAEGDHRPSVAIYNSPWPGEVVIYRSASSSGFELLQSIGQASVIGTLAFDFYSGPSARWDDGNELWVDVCDGTLSSKTDSEVLAGANLLAVVNVDNEFELVGFVSASLEATKRYKLTRLLRGQRGTEHAMRDPVAAGSSVVLISSSVAALTLSIDELGVPLNYRYGAAGKALTDIAFAASDGLTFNGKGLRPLSPVHVAATADGSGDITISWIRRTRTGGDSWGVTEVPLGEDSEAYEVDVWVGGSVVRTLSASSASVAYTAAQASADQGGAPSSIDIEVFQLSSVYGRGVGQRVTLSL